MFNFGATGRNRLLAAQTQMAFNDNATQLILIGLANLVLPPERAGVATSVLIALFIVPYILFYPLFGWMSDRFSKARIIHVGLLLQGTVALALAAMTLWRQFDWEILGFLLLGLQAVAIAPAKQGILKELVGEAGLNAAVSWMESLNLLGALLGSYVGGMILDGLVARTGDPWRGAGLTLGFLAGWCAIAWHIGRGIPIMPSCSTQRFRFSLFWVHFHDLRRLAAQPVLFTVAIGIAWFYGLGNLLYLVLVQVGRISHPGIGAASYAGLLLGLLGAGIAGGAALYTRFSRHRISLRSVPWSAAALTSAVLILAALPPGGRAYPFGLLAVGLTGGTFIIPLNAYLLSKAENQERGRMLAATGLITNLLGITAIGLHLLMAQGMGLGPRRQLAVLAASAGIVAVGAVRVARRSEES